MSNFEAMQRLANRYISDASFRAEMTQDPEGTAKRYGVELDGATRQALRSVSGQVLSRRVSKLIGGAKPQRLAKEDSGPGLLRSGLLHAALGFRESDLSAAR
jgi:hypothetical protein